MDKLLVDYLHNEHTHIMDKPILFFLQSYFHLSPIL